MATGQQYPMNFLLKPRVKALKPQGSADSIGLTILMLKLRRDSGQSTRI